MTYVKICGVTSKEDARLAAACGADAVGVVNIRESLRYVDLRAAKEIFSALPPFIARIIVSKPGSIEEVVRLEDAKPEYVQLHGCESHGFVRGISENSRLGIIKKFDPGSESQEKMEKYAEYVSAFLFDSSDGTGRVHEWEKSRTLAEEVGLPVILAGGLRPENVKAAVAAVRPYGVDTSSGVESSTGKKDPARMERFVEEAKSNGLG